MYWEDRHNAIVPDDTDFQNIKHKKYAKKTANTNQITPPQKIQYCADACKKQPWHVDPGPWTVLSICIGR